ncbi:hypothetical protein OSTOST_07850, partial [Ostertagia ostertagi]
MVTPGLSCTFTLFKGAQMTNVNLSQSLNHYYDDVTLEDCFKECHEKSDCKGFAFKQDVSLCGIIVPGEDVVSRYDFIQWEIYTFDRNV